MDNQFEQDLTSEATFSSTPEEALHTLFSSVGLDSDPAVEGILRRFPRLEGLGLAIDAQLAVIPGVGARRATLVTRAINFGQLVQRAVTIPRWSVLNSEAIGTMLIRRFLGIMQEQMVVFYLNVRNQVVFEETAFKGGLDASIADQRVVMRRALLLGASRILVAHNHPSGNTTPSAQDEAVTKRFVAAGEIVGVTLIDHLVIGADSYMSFREDGYL